MLSYHTLMRAQFVSLPTRDLIRRTASEMQSRLEEVGPLLSTFLEEEEHLDLSYPPEAAEHLKLFRILLQRHYAVQFGQYPPRAAVFNAEMLRVMRRDFEALYESLKDGSRDIASTLQIPIKHDGISPLRTLKEFDLHNDLEPLPYSLPLLPTLKTPRKSRSFLTNLQAKMGRSTEDDDLALLLSRLSALSEPFNSNRPEVAGNGLVSTYRDFEVAQIRSPSKTGKLKRVGPVDGRKIRWILIYEIYQILRKATEVPKEVTNSAGVPYHLSISTAGLPPWGKESNGCSLAPPRLSYCAQVRSKSSAVPATGFDFYHDKYTSLNRGARWDETSMQINAIFHSRRPHSMSRQSSAVWHSFNDTFALKDKLKRSSSKPSREHRRRPADRRHFAGAIESGDMRLANQVLVDHSAPTPQDDPCGPCGRASSSGGTGTSIISEARTSETSDTDVDFPPHRTPWEHQPPKLSRSQSHHGAKCIKGLSLWPATPGLNSVDYGGAARIRGRGSNMASCDESVRVQIAQRRRLSNGLHHESFRRQPQAPPSPPRLSSDAKGKWVERG
ncbi:hypothetical protein F4808DRAFT_432311 [Astrocystis sublimbata]|nr:hypothetical protein F4808DRAFT_432311 [Astrocystis sublimbata]